MYDKSFERSRKPRKEETYFRILNNFIRKERVKFEDRKLALQYFERNCYYDEI